MESLRKKEERSPRTELGVGQRQDVGNERQTANGAAHWWKTQERGAP